MKTMPADIILQKCTKNHDHMLYCSCDMARDRCNCYFSFWAILCSFNPLTAQKIKRKKKKKNPVRYHHFTRVPKIKIRWCMLPEIWCTTDRQTDGRTDRQMDGQADGQKKWHTEFTKFTEAPFPIWETLYYNKLFHCS